MNISNRLTLDNLSKPLLALCLFIICGIPNRSMAQGIKFEEGMTWDEVKSKARTENKCIFIDCYATWCEPCKMMDKEVYTNPEVGRFFNEHFISVKVQMDRTPVDNKHVREWYETSDKINETYSIEAYPCFLFFLPDGMPAHKSIGYKKTDEFIALGKEALDPRKQSFTMIENYTAGKLSDGELKEKSFIEMIVHKTLLIKSSDRLFELCYQKDPAIDIALARHIVQAVIQQENVYPIIKKDGKFVKSSPDWAAIRNTIAGKYSSDVSNHVILESQVTYYHELNDWKNYVIYKNEKMKVNPPSAQNELFGEMNELNFNAWEIFDGSNDKELLKIALTWSDLTLNLTKNEYLKPFWMDTKANILYKLGFKKDALILQKKAIQAAEKIKGARLSKDDNFWKTYYLIRAGKPTWKI